MEVHILDLHLQHYYRYIYFGLILIHTHLLVHSNFKTAALIRCQHIHQVIQAKLIQPLLIQPLETHQSILKCFSMTLSTRI